LTSEKLDAQEAKRLGVIHEVLPASSLQERAWTIARQLAASKPLVLKYSRLALTHQLKRTILEDVPTAFYWKAWPRLTTEHPGRS
jgi:enoyl-CoA hydratase/carnithine racemase